MVDNNAGDNGEYRLLAKDCGRKNSLHPLIIVWLWSFWIYNCYPGFLFCWPGCRVKEDPIAASNDIEGLRMEVKELNRVIRDLQESIHNNT